MEYDASLQNKLIIAMPQMKDAIFEHSVIYICHHDEDGAMGLILNKPITNMTFGELSSHIMEEAPDLSSLNLQNSVFVGGPVEPTQGFILHSADYAPIEQSNKISEDIYLNASVDLLSDIVKGEGPSNFISFLGYSGWAAGQLEQEILANSWLHYTPTADFIWQTPAKNLWKASLEKLGISESFLSSQAGHS